MPNNHDAGPNTPLFFERQTFAKWVFILLTFSTIILPATLILATGEVFWPSIIIIPAVAGVLLALFLGTMQTIVTQEEVLVTFGLLGAIKFHFPLALIKSFRVRTYKPLDEYGGWGIKGWDKHRVLNMKGNRGVELSIDKLGKRQAMDMMIGSQKPEELATVLRELGLKEIA